MNGFPVVTALLRGIQEYIILHVHLSFKMVEASLKAGVPKQSNSAGHFCQATISNQQLTHVVKAGKQMTFALIKKFQLHINHLQYVKFME